MRALRDIVEKPMLSTADLVTWGIPVGPGVVLCKNGMLLAGWYYEGSDSSAQSEPEQEHVAQVTNAALASLGGEYSLWIDACRMPFVQYPSEDQCHFPDPVTRLIDSERREQYASAGAHYKTLQAIVIGYMLPTDKEARLGSFMFEGADTSKDAGAQKALETFVRTIDDLEDRLIGVLGLCRMISKPIPGIDNAEEDELLTHLRYCLTGDFATTLLPPPGVFLDSTLNAQLLVTGLTPKVGEDYVCTVGIDAFPESSYTGIIDILATLPFPCRWSTRWIALDQVDAMAVLQKYRRQWAQKTRSLLDQILQRDHREGTQVNQDAVAMVADVDQANALAESGMAGFGYFTANILIRGPSLPVVTEQARTVRQVIIQQGFGARIEDMNAVETFLGTLPGHIGENVRRPVMHTRHLANMLALTTAWTGLPTCPNPMYPPNSPPLVMATTDNSTPFCFNLAVGDVGHTLLFGPTGMGKSTLLCFLAAQFRRYPNARVQTFDIGRSMEALTMGVGGTHFDVSGDGSSLSFAPLAQLTEDVAWEADYIETLMRLQGHVPTAPERNEITRALLAMARSDQNSNMTVLEITLQASNLKDLIKPYTVNGAYGNLLDAEGATNVYADPWQCFEVGELMNLDDKVRLPVLLHLFHEIERHFDGTPSLLILDEAWAMLGHDVFRDKIREWLKTLRKQNVSVVMATQSLSDATRSGILDVLVESCLTNIFLPNPEARQGDPRTLYESLGLRPGEIETIATATAKREYLVRSTLGSRLVNFHLGSVAMAFCGVAPAELPPLREMKERMGDTWYATYLEERGITYAG